MGRISNPEQVLNSLLKTGLQAADPFRPTFLQLPKRPAGKLFILSVGKAAYPMAQAAGDFYGEDFDGVLYAPEGYAKDVKGFETCEGDHPVPTKRNAETTEKIIGKVQPLKKGDLFLALVSGGTSALLTLPKTGVSLDKKIAETKKLLKSGKDIYALNTRRKEMSAVKGGRLAAMAAPADVKTLIVSDVPGDDPAIVGSGPTVQGEGNAKIILKADDMLARVQAGADEAGLFVTNLGSRTRQGVDNFSEKLAQRIQKETRTPHLFLSGGELGVKVKGKGQGGRNSHFILRLAKALGPAQNISAVSVDTDGLDGTGPHAGARLTPGVLNQIYSRGLNMEKYLKNNDSAGFFKKFKCLVMTGPTHTNLNDLRLILKD